MKDVDFGEPTSFLDHVYLGCTQRECQIKIFRISIKVCFESRISAGAMRNYQKLKAPGKPETNTISLHDMESHAKEMRGKILRTGE